MDDRRIPRERYFRNAIGVRLRVIGNAAILIRRPGEKAWSLYRSFERESETQNYLDFMAMWGGYWEEEESHERKEK